MIVLTLISSTEALFAHFERFSYVSPEGCACDRYMDRLLACYKPIMCSLMTADSLKNGQILS